MNHAAFLARRAGLFASAFGLLLGSGSAGATLYGATGGNAFSDLYTINPATGAAVSVGPIGFAVTGLAFDPTTGILYGVTSNQSPASPHSLITVDPATGAGTLIGDEQLGNTGIADITFDASGTLYGWSEGSDELVSIDKSTGQATQLGDTGLSTYGSGIVDVGGILYFTGQGNEQDLRTVNKATGATTVVATLNGGPGFPGDPIAALTTDGATLYGALNTDFGDEVAFLVTIDEDSGLITEIGPVVQGLDAIAFTVDDDIPGGGGAHGPPELPPLVMVDNGSLDWRLLSLLILAVPVRRWRARRQTNA